MTKKQAAVSLRSQRVLDGAIAPQLLHLAVLGGGRIDDANALFPLAAIIGLLLVLRSRPPSGGSGRHYSDRLELGLGRSIMLHGRN